MPLYANQIASVRDLFCVISQKPKDPQGKSAGLGTLRQKLPACRVEQSVGSLLFGSSKDCVFKRIDFSRAELEVR